MGQIIKKHWLVILFLVFYGLITGYKFIHYPTPFYDWDEAIYAQVGREMVNNKSFVPLWQEKVWLDKPPLVPITYGLVETIAPVPPELSTRFFTLFLSLIVLLLSYIIYYRVTKDQFVSTISVALGSFLTIFLQRTQVLNVDVFLLIGWLGYLVFFPQFWLSFLFLAVGVLSKSLLGFYPLLMYGLFVMYQLFVRKIDKKECIKLIKIIIFQAAIILLWYVVMLVVYKYDFVKAHFIESHLKRVTASIESHFGKRTFYFDLLFNQMGVFKYFIPLGLIMIIVDYFRSKDTKRMFLALFFIPWFLFLNLTKTKIDWYLYPALIQFSFLAVYPLTLFKKVKIVYFLGCIFVIGCILKNSFFNGIFYNTHYSKYDQNYQLAVQAKKDCSAIYYLIDQETRKTYSVLENMNLTITTTSWWGNHPLIVYYSGKRVDFIYNKDDFLENLPNFEKGSCLVLYNDDINIVEANINVRQIGQFQELNLFIQN